MTPSSSADAPAGSWRVAGPPAIALAAVLLAVASRYDLHGDELYFRMLPWAWWYDDQPPLTVWLSRAAAAAGDAIWLQRLPAVVAAALAVVVTATIPRLLGYDVRIQRLAAWAHASAAYPMIAGHVFLTASIDLLAWEVVILLVVAALRGHRRALIWAGVVVGVACWNKLLILVLAAALTGGLLLGAPHVLRTREAVAGAAAAAVIGGPQIVMQLAHGLPMSDVSAGLVARDGAVNRALVLPVLVAFLGPPFLPLWWRGLRWRPDGPQPGGPDPNGSPSKGSPSNGGLPVFLVTGLLLIVWTLVVPAQPYYPVAAFLPVLAIGWGMADDAGRLPSHASVRIAANALVSAVIALPLVPFPGTAFDVLARADPVLRDQAGWAGYVDQVAAARGGPGVAVVTGTYALAGAAAYHGPAVGIDRSEVFSGHNALWSLGPPRTGDVLLVGAEAVTHRDLFRSCRDAGSLASTGADPFRTAGSPMLRCHGPIGGWDQVWPRFRRLGG